MAIRCDGAAKGCNSQLPGHSEHFDKVFDLHCFTIVPGTGCVDFDACRFASPVSSAVTICSIIRSKTGFTRPLSNLNNADLSFRAVFINLRQPLHCSVRTGYRSVSMWYSIPINTMHHFSGSRTNLNHHIFSYVFFTSMMVQVLQIAYACSCSIINLYINIRYRSLISIYDISCQPSTS